MRITRRPFLTGLVGVPALGWVVSSYMSDAAAADYGAERQVPESQNLPTRTKVIRLIVVPSEIDPTNATAIQEFARGQGAAKNDTFIVKEPTTGEWHPMSWRGGALVDHEEATRTDRECTPSVTVTNGEQIQWESDHEFWIESINKKDSVPEARLINGPAGPDNPFPMLQLRTRVGKGRSIRSGPAIMDKQYTQLYKLTFGMVLEGREVIIDPDFYCEWH